jgi:hypothetical protein
MSGCMRFHSIASRRGAVRGTRVRIANSALSPGASVPIGRQLSMPTFFAGVKRITGHHGNRNGLRLVFLRRTRKSIGRPRWARRGSSSAALSGHRLGSSDGGRGGGANAVTLTEVPRAQPGTRTASAGNEP